MFYIDWNWLKNELQSIKKIVFGCATTPENKELIEGWVNQNSLQVKYYQAKLKDGSYALGLKEI